MKYLILVGDGMADFPLDELNGQTPLAAASIPNMDQAARLGQTGLYCPIPDDLPPGSDIGNLSLFGYDPHQTFTGRAPLEAANQGITLTEDQIAFRCNLVCLQDGRMVDFTSGHIRTEDADELVQALKPLYQDDALTLNTGVSYRHLCIITGTPEEIQALASTQCTPPHDITGREYASYLPDGPGGDILRELMARSQRFLADHPQTARRQGEGHHPATSIWLWGQGCAPKLEKYPDLFGLTGSVISAVDLVNGIGVCAGLSPVRVEGATGYLDTNYAGKVQAAVTALESRDFVYLHVEAPDETAHEGKTDLKMQAIEDFDRYVVGPCMEFARKRGDVRILIAPDHVTAISTKTHAGGPVPFIVYGAGVPESGVAAYSEVAAAETGLVVRDGFQLTRTFLKSDTFVL